MKKKGTLTKIGTNIFKITYGEKSDSLIVSYEWKDEENIKESVLPKGQETKISLSERRAGGEAEPTSALGSGAGALPPAGEIVLSEPEFEPYDIYGISGSEQVIRRTVDGVKVLLKEGVSEVVDSSHHARLTIKIPEAPMFGLGSHEEGYPSLNGQFIRMFQENMRIAVPVLVSAAGFMILVDNCGYQEYDFTRPGEIGIFLDAADAVEIYVITGSCKELYAGYRLLTGITPMLPKWVCGFIQSKERYVDAGELVSVVKKYRELGVPLDCIVQDWQYWKGWLWGEKIFDKERYPDPAATFSAIHDMGAKVMLSIWPNMSGDGENIREFRERDLLLKCGSVYNAFSKEARDLYWKQVEEGLFSYGLDALWADSTEPYDANWEGENRPDPETEKTKAVAEFKKYINDRQINVFNFYHTMGLYEGQRRVSNKRVVNLTRSGYAGQHRYSSVVWSGDISASWETLARQVHILQNYIATGEAYWNSDVAGFFAASCDPWFWKGQFEAGMEDEGYRELFVRWLQFAAFTPMMRAHGTDCPREIWRLGERGTKYFDSAEIAIRERYRLLPFFYSLCGAVTFKGEMPVSPLAMVYGGEERLPAEAYDEFLCGDSLLVCPVTKPGATTQRIYLPKGIWYDFYSYERFEGGRIIELPVTLDHLPVFAKAGAIIPTTEVMQYSGEKPKAPVEALIFPGADGRFDLYEDADDGYDYEKGAYCFTHISYCDATGEIRTEVEGDAFFARELTFRKITSPF